MNDKRLKKAIFISSTGGHLSELMMLEPMFSKFDYHLVTEKTGSTKSLKNVYGKRIDYLVFGTRENKISYIFKFGFNCLKSLWIFLKKRPDVVITTGTHTAVPMCYIAHLFKKKVVFIETYANITSRTKSGNFVYKIADLFIVQWPEMLELYPNAICLGGVF